MKKTFTLFTVLLVVLILALALVACNKNEEHEHDYEFDSFVWTETATGWTAQAKLVCKGDNTHISMENATVTVTSDVAATCEAAGAKVYRATYGDNHEDKTETLAKLNHDYHFDSFVWDESVSGNWTAQAKLICANDPTHISLVAATMSVVSNTPATCQAAGSKVYRVTYGDESEERTENFVALDHDYSFDSFVWNESVSGNWTAQAKLICANDPTHISLVAATMSVVSNTPATCQAAGAKVYRATYGTHQEDRTENFAQLSHNADAYGFCTVGGEYLGETGTLTDEGIYMQYYSPAFSIETGKVYYYRVGGGVSGHGFELEDIDGTVDFTTLQACFKAYVKSGNAFIEVAFDGTEAVTFGTEDEAYLYIVIIATVDDTLGYFRIVDRHIFNEAGVCEVDGEFIDYSNGDRGYEIPKGSESKTGISYSGDGKIGYYHIVEDILPFEHHKFRVNTTNIPHSHVELYYVDENFEAHQLSIEENEEEEVPAGVKDLYVVIFHMDDVTNGSFALQRVEHCAAEHGYCPGCDLILSGTRLTMNADYGAGFDVEEGVSYNFYFDFCDPTQIENFQLDFNGFGTFVNHGVPSYALFVYDGSEFILVEPVTTSGNSIEYDLENVYYEVSYAFFTFVGLGNQTGVQLRVHDFS